MKRSFVAAALLGALFLASPARAAGPGALVGVGHVEGAACGGTAVVVGVNPAGSMWAFSVTEVPDEPGTDCPLVNSATANGNWDPATGGCVPPATGIICVGKVPQQATPTTTSISFCTPTSGCFNGTVTVVRV